MHPRQFQPSFRFMSEFFHPSNVCYTGTYFHPLNNSSYTTDPQYQLKFSIIWVAFAGAAILISLPTLVRSIRKGYTWAGVTGITEDLSGRAKVYEPIPADESKDAKISAATRGEIPFERLHGIFAIMKSFTMWSIPQVGLDMGQGKRSISSSSQVLTANLYYSFSCRYLYSCHSTLHHHAFRAHGQSESSWYVHDPPPFAFTGPLNHPPN